MKYQKIVEKEKIYKLLLGLNRDLDEVRGRILSQKPISLIREAFSEVWREENRKKVMIGSHSAGLPSIETSALVARFSNPQNNDARTRKRRSWCDRWTKPRHFRDNCWKIYGKPADWKPSRQNSNSQAFVVVPEGRPNGKSTLFSNEQIEMLKKMFGQPQPSTSAL